MITALALFGIMYALLLKFADKRYLIALGFAVIFVVAGFVPVEQVLPAINWNIILMLTGTMIVVELFIESRMPVRLAEMLLQAVPTVKMAVVFLSLFAGLISAFVDNVATVLMVAPVALAVCRQLNTNPVPAIISIAVSSNLQGAATLVGDTTSILLGDYAKMSFNDFFWFMGKPGICFAVEIGALITIPVLMYLFRNEKQSVKSSVMTVTRDYMPSVLMIGIVAGLITASQFPEKPELTNGYICLGLGTFGILYEMIRQKSTKVLKSSLAAVDYQTLVLLSGLFVVIRGITNAGVIDAVASVFVQWGGDSLFQMYAMIVGVSVILSAFIDNIPYVATMLPVVSGIAELMGVEPYVLYYGLLIGATLGGNLTPVGASANIAGIGILQKAEYEVKTKDFLRIGVPFTLLAVLSGATVIWLVWA